MNYGQFLQMMPEVILVLTLIVVFLCDMFTKDTEKRSLVVVATFGPLVYLLCHILFINPIYNGEVSAFGGMYFQQCVHHSHQGYPDLWSIGGADHVTPLGKPCGCAEECR